MGWTTENARSNTKKIFTFRTQFHLCLDQTFYWRHKVFYHT
jgi:hypothetical protein